MPRPPRSIMGDTVYHILNRANGRMGIFEKEKDYVAFENILVEAKEKFPMRILAYCIMPNHWHFVLFPEKDNELSAFMRWLTLTHTQRWLVHRKMVGYGHLYQGRYKSFPVQKDDHFLTLCRYVERNALRARLVSRAEDWRWSSAWIRTYGTDEQQKLLSPWPVPMTNDYTMGLNETYPHEESVLEDIRGIIARGKPFGDEVWVKKTAESHSLETTLTTRGRPRKGT